MSDISSVPEALKLLNVLVKQTKRLLDIDFSERQMILIIRGSGKTTARELLTCVPMLAEGAEAVLKVRGDVMKLLEDRNGTDFEKGYMAGAEATANSMIVEKANAYRPALVELGWWK